MEVLLNPARPRYRWWADDWPLIWRLEDHAARLDEHFARLCPADKTGHPALRRYLASFRVPPWDIIGWQSIAEGPWPLRRIVTLLPEDPRLADGEPLVLCLDGPTDSPHRNGPIELCLYYPPDPAERRWQAEDGLVRLFDLARRHLWCEHIWRERGRKGPDWPVEQAAHGFADAPAAPDQELTRQPVICQLSSRVVPKRNP